MVKWIAGLIKNTGQVPLPVTAIKLTILRRRADFLAVAAHGKKWVAPSLVLQIKPQSLITDPQSPAIGYGLTASRKVGNAVSRNRARRRLRALANELLPLRGRPGHDYVLIARLATVTCDHAALKKDLLWALRKLGA